MASSSAPSGRSTIASMTADRKSAVDSADGGEACRSGSVKKGRRGVSRRGGARGFGLVDLRWGLRTASQWTSRMSGSNKRPSPSTAMHVLSPSARSEESSRAPAQRAQ
eukprot:scaffold14006_cov114-Isochrysis_galbana.AAC.5